MALERIRLYWFKGRIRTEIFHKLWRSHGTAAFICTQGMMDQKSMKMSEVWPALMFITRDKAGLRSGIGLCDPNESIPIGYDFIGKRLFRAIKIRGNPSRGSDNGTKNPGSHVRGKKIPYDPFQRESRPRAPL